MWIWIGLMMLGTGVAGAQATSAQQQQTVQPGVIGVPIAPSDPERVRQEQQREQMATDERRKRMVSDADKLLALAAELKADVDKSSKNELSMEVIRKAAEIEKLAHDVKERMRN
jgi:predicted TIM-barrel fold metal-dependent hydrolase